MSSPNTVSNIVPSVVVAEGERVWQLLFDPALTRAGLEMEVATTVTDALAAAYNSEAVAIICSMQVGSDPTGAVRLLTELRNDKELSTVPVWVLSSAGDSPVVVKTIQALNGRIIHKPCNPSAVVAEICREQNLPLISASYGFWSESRYDGEDSDRDNALLMLEGMLAAQEWEADSWRKLWEGASVKENCQGTYR